jgi:hypothetical protein
MRALDAKLELIDTALVPAGAGNAAGVEIARVGEIGRMARKYKIVETKLRTP